MQNTTNSAAQALSGAAPRSGPWCGHGSWALRLEELRPTHWVRRIKFVLMQLGLGCCHFVVRTIRHSLFSISNNLTLQIPDYPDNKMNCCGFFWFVNVFAGAMEPRSWYSFVHVGRIFDINNIPVVLEQNIELVAETIKGLLRYCRTSKRFMQVRNMD